MTIASIAPPMAAARCARCRFRDPPPRRRQVVRCRLSPANTCRLWRRRSRPLPELGIGANVEMKASAARRRRNRDSRRRSAGRLWPPQLPPPMISSFVTDALTGARDRAPAIARGLLVRAAAAQLAAPSLRLWAARRSTPTTGCCGRRSWPKSAERDILCSPIRSTMWRGHVNYSTGVSLPFSPMFPILYLRRWRPGARRPRPRRSFIREISTGARL